MERRGVLRGRGGTGNLTSRSSDKSLIKRTHYLTAMEKSATLGSTSHANHPFVDRKRFAAVAVTCCRATHRLAPREESIVLRPG